MDFKSTGIIRKLDELGRVTLPIEIRRSLNLTDSNSAVSILLDGLCIKISKATDKPNGTVRRLDDLGRITLPIEIRRTLHIEEKDRLEIFLSDFEIQLIPYETKDVFTGELLTETDIPIEYCGYVVSLASVRKLAEKAGLKIAE